LCGLKRQFQDGKQQGVHMTFTTTNVTVNFINSSGNAVATASRPLRVLPNGKDFGVVRKGKVLPFLPTGTNEGSAVVGGDSFTVDQCRAAKMSDLGLKTKSEVKASKPKATRTVAQQEATVNMLTAKLQAKPTPAVKKAHATATNNLARLKSSEADKPQLDLSSMTKEQLVSILAKLG